VERDIRCTKCGKEFVSEEVKETDRCPSCGTDCTPQLISDDVTVKVNWQDLRILCGWAANYVVNLNTDMQEVFVAMVNRLMPFRPEGSAALTLEEEVREVQAKFPEVTLYGIDGRILIPPKDIGKA
jgi:hypothetical protein